MKSKRLTKCIDSSRVGFKHVPLGFGLTKDSYAFWELLLFKLRAAFFLCTEGARITHLFGRPHPSFSRSGAGAFMRKKQLTAIGTGILQEGFAERS